MFHYHDDCLATKTFWFILSIHDEMWHIYPICERLISKPKNNQTQLKLRLIAINFRTTKSHDHWHYQHQHTTFHIVCPNYSFEILNENAR